MERPRANRSVGCKHASPFIWWFLCNTDNPQHVFISSGDVDRMSVQTICQEKQLQTFVLSFHT